ncbi:hypothetical protein GIY56_13900 [Paracoccus sp. YIM 132242]|uniref:DUF4760 domain-containing protein n=1 Tax=Paracoccus lichenicola TaxID=2665644 RepID=A0A6L6HSI0_9RHOB|nr:hypothetical protein [Paracoccus lichenicola]MTE01379.1 hypothetical protein [Paracoccus lichenicola]
MKLLTWFFSLDPRIIQSVASVATATIASLTALFIAVYVYGRQKRLDARYKLAEEIRGTCAKLAEACSSIIEDPAGVRTENVLQSVGAKLARVNYYENLLIMQRAPIELVTSAQELSRSYAACLKYLYEAFQESRPPEKFKELSAKLFADRAKFVMIARDQSVRLAK